MSGSIAAFVQGHCKRHDPEASKTHGARQQEPMLANSAAERDRAEDHRQREADLVDDWLAEHSAGRGDEPEQHGGGDAMHGAQARKGHRDPVKPGRGKRP